MKNNVILKVENLNKNYIHNDKSFHILKDLNFEIYENDIVALIGKSGSGKTTLINCISKTDNEFSGNIYLNGKQFSNLKTNTKDNDFFRKNLQVIFQDYNSSLDLQKNIYKILKEILIINKFINQDLLIYKKNVHKIKEAKKIFVKKIELNNQKIINIQVNNNLLLNNLFEKFNFNKNIFSNTVQNFEIINSFYNSLKEKYFELINNLNNLYENNLIFFFNFLNNKIFPESEKTLFKNYNIEDLKKSKKILNQNFKNLKKYEKWFLENTKNFLVQKNIDIKDLNFQMNKYNSFFISYNKIIKNFHSDKYQAINNLHNLKYLFYTNKINTKIFNNFIFKNVVIKHKIFNVLKQVNLKNDIFYKYPHELSGGEKQRLTIAKALILEPKIIVADEPISSLDNKNAKDIVELFKNINKNSKVAIFFISHQTHLLKGFSNKIWTIKNGQLINK